MIKTSRQRKASGSLYQESLPLYFRGDLTLFNFIQIRLQTTITFSKPHIISLPLKTFNNQKQDFVQPLAQIQTFDQMSKQSLLKNKSLIKEGVFYVYFPANVRVDQKIYKIYDKNFQNFLKDVPKAFKQNFAKIIIYEEGKDQHSIFNQIKKLQQMLSNTIKSTIQKKIQIFLSQIATLQGLQLNPKILKSLFVARNKISSIFKQLKLPLLASQHLTNLFNDLLYNSKKFLQVNGKQANTQKVIFKSPFIVHNINTIFTYFDSRNCFLQILNFCFIKAYQIHLETLQAGEAIKRLKQYLDFVISNIWGPVGSKQQDIAKNIWLVETIDQALKIMKSRDIKPIMNTQKQEQFQLLNVSVCGMYRNAIQRIGVIFYGLNTYCVFPRNLQYELQLCIKNMKGLQVTQKEYPQLKIINRQLQINKLLFLSGQAIHETIEMILNNFNSFKTVYIRTLELMEQTLSNSPYKKVSWSMKLSVLKSTIIYFSNQAPSPLSLSSLLEQPASLSYDTRKSVWQNLEIINKVYRMTLCKRYEVKMSVQELLNVILDEGIVQVVQKWRLLVEIVAGMLFEDNDEKQIQEKQQNTKHSQNSFNNQNKKQKQTKNTILDQVDFGQGQEENDGNFIRRRRRTTIHYKEKEIEVGTLKFISLIQSNDSVIESPSFTSTNNNTSANSKINLNIELSNRIVSYAFPLIQKSKALHNKFIEKQNTVQVQQGKQKIITSQSHKQLISLNFQIVTLIGQKKLIPFQIIQCDDKIIQVEIKTTQVMIFRINKLLIDVDQQIRLVYTMPINHQKSQFYEKQNVQNQQHYYMNICPQLKINTVKLFIPSNQTKIQEDSTKIRKQSGSSTTSKPNSLSSSPNANYLIYKKLWTPIKFMFTFAQNDQINIEKIQINTPQDVYGKIFVGQTQISYKEINSFKINSNQKDKFAVIIFLKSKDINQSQKTGKQGNTILPSSFANTAINNLNIPHKQSMSLQPKSLRSRTNSVAQSAGGSYFNDGNRIILTLHICHHSYKYKVSQELQYGKVSPFKVEYRYAHEFEEYTLGNITDQVMEVQVGENTKQIDEIVELYPGEEMKVYHNQVKVCLKFQDEHTQNTDESSDQDDDSSEEQINVMRLLKLNQVIDLRSMIKKQHLKPQKISTLCLSLCPSSQEHYPLFQPIYISSEQAGYVSVLKHNQNDSQLIGKTQGMVGYIAQARSSYQNTLQLMVVPTKRGIITLPEISINCRKGVWKNGKTIKVI